jgi:hypothetical protein
LAKGVNPGRKSVVLQEAGGLGLRLAFSSCKIVQAENGNKPVDVLEVARAQTWL